MKSGWRAKLPGHDRKKSGKFQLGSEVCHCGKCSDVFDRAIKNAKEMQESPDCLVWSMTMLYATIAILAKIQEPIMAAKGVHPDEIERLNAKSVKLIKRRTKQMLNDNKEFVVTKIMAEVFEVPGADGLMDNLKKLKEAIDASK